MAGISVVKKSENNYYLVVGKKARMMSDLSIKWSDVLIF